MEKVAQVKVKDNLKKTIVEAVDAVGGLRKFIKMGDVVMLKPNFNSDD